MGNNFAMNLIKTKGQTQAKKRNSKETKCSYDG